MECAQQMDRKLGSGLVAGLGPELLCALDHMPAVQQWQKKGSVNERQAPLLQWGEWGGRVPITPLSQEPEPNPQE